MNNFFVTLITWVWCFPQMLVGFIFSKISKAKKNGDHYIIENKYGGSVSLGTYVFICQAHRYDKNVLKHEQGHTKQSYILGWLYLPLVGLPSFIWANCFKNYRYRKNIDYHSVYPENWADKLGGVNR